MSSMATFLLFLSFLFVCVHFSSADPFIGVKYGQVADLSMAYDIGISKSSQTRQSTTETSYSRWCVAKAGISDDELKLSLDYACGQRRIDCGPIQPGGACFEPNTVASHAAYAMNLYYQASSKYPSDCDFSQTATLTYQDPSYNNCIYPGGDT